MNLQYSKISNLLDRYLDLYNKKDDHASNITLSSVSSRKDESEGTGQGSHRSEESHELPDSKDVYEPINQEVTHLVNSAAYAAGQKFDACEGEKIIADIKLQKANDAISRLTKRYNLNSNDIADVVADSLTADDEASEFAFQPQDYTISRQKLQENVESIESDDILNPRPEERYNAEKPADCCAILLDSPDFHLEHARAARNLEPAPAVPQHREPKISTMEYNSLYAEIERQKLIIEVHEQTILDLKADNAKLRRTKRTQQKGRAKFKLLEDELSAAKTRIQELEQRERRLQDLVSELRRQ